MTQFGVNRPAWAPAALDDQHTAGGILWAVAEVFDLPFLVLAATRWMLADAVEARRIDAEPRPRGRPLRRCIRPAALLSRPVSTGHQQLQPIRPAPSMTRPWWLDDPELRDRYRS